jgi:hypothetical protein
MNNNSLNWSDNRVVGSAGAAQNKAYGESPMQPYRETMPADYGTMPDYQQQNASPSTYRQQTYQTASEQGSEGTSTRSDAYAPNPIFNVPGPPSVMDPGYIPGYLKTQIGKMVRAEFVFNNLYLDKTGVLREVGYNYFVLEDNATGARIMCDLYSARFVTSV